MLRARGVTFAGDRRRDAGYVPPCALPDLHATRPEIWAEVLASRPDRNRTFARCASSHAA